MRRISYVVATPEFFLIRALMLSSVEHKINFPRPTFRPSIVPRCCCTSPQYPDSCCLSPCCANRHLVLKAGLCRRCLHRAWSALHQGLRLDLRRVEYYCDDHTFYVDDGGFRPVCQCQHQDLQRPTTLGRHRGPAGEVENWGIWTNADQGKQYQRG